jgi:tRNA threonylcarbamoyladenosine biosynthesis protein TsaB
MSAILFIDTTQDSCQLGLFYNEHLLVHCHTIERQHAAVINSMIANLLEEQHCSFEELAAVAVCAGPGSYTGIRVGIATAQGLGFAKQIPVHYFSALTLLNYQWIQEKAAVEGYYCTVLKAREQEVFFEIANEKGHIVEEGKHALLADLIQTLENYAVKNLYIQSNINIDFNSITSTQVYKETVSINIKQWNQYFQQFCTFQSLTDNKALYLKDIFVKA